MTTQTARQAASLAFQLLRAIAVALQTGGRLFWKATVWAFTDRLPERPEDELRTGWFDAHVDISDEIDHMERAHRSALAPMVVGGAVLAALLLLGVSMVASAPAIGEERPGPEVDTGETAITIASVPD